MRERESENVRERIYKIFDFVWDGDRDQYKDST